MRQLLFLMHGRKKIFDTAAPRGRKPVSRLPGGGRTWYNRVTTPCKGENFHAGESGRQKGDAARRARLDESAGVRLHRADRLDGRERLLFHLHSEKHHGRRLGDVRDRRGQRHRRRARDDLQRRVVGPRGQAPRLRLLGGTSSGASQRRRSPSSATGRSAATSASR